MIAFCLGGLACAKVGAPDPSGTGGASGDDGGVIDAPVDMGAAGADPFADAHLFERPPSSVCGNSIIEFGENCDDANNISGDGCSSACVSELHYTCTKVGELCVHDVVCGDGMIEGMEACDDGNTKSGDGCAADCTLECGWVCPPNTLCRADKCGDGKVAGNEQCDDGNIVDGDGCSAKCTLEGKPVSVAEGWICTSPMAAGADGGAAVCTGPTTCTTTVCGNGKKEGSEQCDDGNMGTGDGCSPFCRLEPKCVATGGACSSVCGDGLLLPADAADLTNCDDGNTVSGDGCSSACKVEPGFNCTGIPVNPTTLVLPIVYHDFKGWKEVGGHPDFEHYQGNGQAGIAQSALGSASGGIPVHAPMCEAWSSNLCPPGAANPTWDPAVDWFAMWYADNATYNKTIVSTLTLPQIAGGAFQFSDEAFFPIDGMGWGNTPGWTHNYSFTSATRYWFEYSGVATLTFVGDDDVFVFVNKQLAVDLGGTHQRATGSITLDAADGTGYACDYVLPGKTGACDGTAKTGGHVIPLGLKIGSVYEIVVFQAERFTTESHYQLTLSGFKGTKSSCVGMCGDGSVVPPEICDLGATMNTGAYGGCKADCTLAPFCGDKIVQGASGEECDGTTDCGADCKKIVVK